jgi:hypothetical protein
MQEVAFGWPKEIAVMYFVDVLLPFEGIATGRNERQRIGWERRERG